METPSHGMQQEPATAQLVNKEYMPSTNKKYEIHNQFTGALEEANTFAGIRSIQDRIKAEYFATLANLFVITVLVENAEDGTWTQSISDANGEPVPKEEWEEDKVYT